VKVAVTMTLDVRLKVHVVTVLEQPPPDQPLKVDPVPGVSVNLTAVPDGYVPPPATVPVPVPVYVRVTV
jgi:hypothetical protein